MELVDKKEHILRCIDLGLSFFKSCLCAECTEEEIEILEKDTQFQKNIEIKKSISEYNLLRKHDTALEVAKMKGNATPIQWRLSILDPGKYGDRLSLDAREKVDLVKFDIPLDDKQKKDYEDRVMQALGKDVLK